MVPKFFACPRQQALANRPRGRRISYRRTRILAVESLERREVMSAAAWDSRSLDLFNPTPYPGYPDTSSGGLTTPQAGLRLVNSIGVLDASGDDTPGTVFRAGAIRIDASAVKPPAPVQKAYVDAIQGGLVTTVWSSESLRNYSYAPNWPVAWQSLLVDLSAKLPTSGDFQIRLRADLANGQTYLSGSAPIRVQDGPTKIGTVAPETFSIGSWFEEGTVIRGGGGTDVLQLTGVTAALVASIDGMTYKDFLQLKPTTGQAIYRGSAYDCLRLTDGREVYFQGIERLKLDGGIQVPLAYTPNDPEFHDQWNLHATDVPSAWRYTKGSSSVLLASLDTGLLSPTQRQVEVRDARGNVVRDTAGNVVYTWTNNVGTVNDMNATRMITDATDDDNVRYPNYFGHGHAAMSVMAAASNNGAGVAGINWNSSVLVADVYGRWMPSGSGVSLQQAIQTAINQARSQGQRVVFQCGVQGETWLNDGGTQQQLERLFTDNADIALFAIAAGNGGQDMNWTTGDSAGVARLSATHGNVISVGAAERVDGTVPGGLLNTTDVRRASYSNFGSALTLAAPVDSPAMDKFSLISFAGTSCANPHVAGVASLVWSVNATLRGDEVRQILIDTAMDVGAVGRDFNFGYGLVDADSAVRRAVALARNRDLALLVPMGGSGPLQTAFSLPPSSWTGLRFPPAAPLDEAFTSSVAALSMATAPAAGDGSGIAVRNIGSTAGADAVPAEVARQRIRATSADLPSAAIAIQHRSDIASIVTAGGASQEPALVDELFASEFDAKDEKGLFRPMRALRLGSLGNGRA